LYGLAVLKELILLQSVTRNFYFKGYKYLPKSERCILGSMYEREVLYWK